MVRLAVILLLGFVVACGSKPTGTALDGGLDGGAVLTDGGLADGGLADGGLADGGLADGGLADGGVADGGVADGGVADGGTRPDGGSGDGGLADGGPRPDGGVADGGPLACTEASQCQADWCGCGRCTVEQIHCVRGPPPPCPLGCPAQACPELAQTTCDCQGGSCVKAGTGPVECTSSTECPPDSKCCYPCGIPGCTNRCTVVGDGGCPLLP